MPRRISRPGVAASIILILSGCQPDSLVPEVTTPWPSAIAGHPGSGSDSPSVLRPIPLPSPTFSPWIRPTPSPPLRTTSTDQILFAPDWSDTPIGKAPTGFTDPAASPDHPAWLHSGNWTIASDRNGVVWQCNEEAPQPYLSFRTWLHTGLPERYTVTMAIRPISSVHYQPPVGEIALIPLYTDPTHYVEVVVAAERLSVWAVDGGAPGNAQGWRGIKFLPYHAEVGQSRTVRMQVDRSAGMLQLDTDGQVVTIADDALKAVPKGVAIRSSGNRFAIPVFRVERS